jgi:hypothetical protein
VVQYNFLFGLVAVVQIAIVLIWNRNSLR